MQRLGASIRARAGARNRPRTATSAITWPSSPRHPGAADKSPAELAVEGVALIMAGIRATLSATGCTSTCWYLEATLYEGRAERVDKALERLLADGHAYRHDGAIWLRTTALAATRRTARWSAPTASRRISPRT